MTLMSQLFTVIVLFNASSNSFLTVEQHMGGLEHTVLITEWRSNIEKSV